MASYISEQPSRPADVYPPAGYYHSVPAEQALPPPGEPRTTHQLYANYSDSGSGYYEQGHNAGSSPALTVCTNPTSTVCTSPTSTVCASPASTVCASPASTVCTSPASTVCTNSAPTACTGPFSAQYPNSTPMPEDYTVQPPTEWIQAPYTGNSCFRPAIQHRQEYVSEREYVIVTRIRF